MWLRGLGLSACTVSGNTIADEKHWNIVAHHVIAALTRVELDSKSTGVTQCLGGATLMDMTVE